MKGVKMNMISVMMMVVLVIMYSVVSDDECCKQCQVICCGEGLPPSLKCFVKCIEGCPDRGSCDSSCCFYPPCSMLLNSL